MSPIQFPTAEEVPPEARIDTSKLDMRYFVGGEIRTWEGAGEVVLSPVCIRRPDGTLARHVVGRMAQLDEQGALGALTAACEAWDHGRGAWPRMRVARRIACTEKFAAGMVKVREDVVRLTMWEIGKSRKDAETEFDRTVQYVRDTVEALKEIDRGAGRFVMEEGFLAQIRRAPLGVVLCMGPFNYPLNETYTTLIPALVMGNTIVSKLPKYGAMLHLPLLEAMREAFPPGTINIIQGDGPTTVGPIMRSGLVDVLAFIGTSGVANTLKRQHPRPNRLLSVTGLESKNPAIVLPCADLDVAVKECVSGALSFNGQRCTAIKLIFVHSSKADAFLAKLCAAVDALKAGMPWEAGVMLTPLPEAGKPEQLARLVEDATKKGARVINDGGAVVGTFFRPAVVFPVTPDMDLYKVEQFGPIIPVAVYEDEAQIDEFMRASSYGQQIALFGTDPKRLAELIDVLANQVCRINLNSQCRRGPDTFPFSGRKDSGEGTLSVADALLAFTIRAVVATGSNEQNKEIVSEIVSRRLSSFLSTDFIF